MSDTVAVMKTVDASLLMSIEDLRMTGEKAWLVVMNEVNSSVRRIVFVFTVFFMSVGFFVKLFMV